jgi:hypothetical protein
VIRVLRVLSKPIARPINGPRKGYSGHSIAIETPFNGYYNYFKYNNPEPEEPPIP